MTSRSLKAATATLLAIFGLELPTSSQANTCLVSLSPPEEAYFVLGSPVIPQSNYLGVVSCDSADQDASLVGTRPPRFDAEAMAIVPLGIEPAERASGHVPGPNPAGAPVSAVQEYPESIRRILRLNNVISFRLTLLNYSISSTQHGYAS